MLLLFHSFTLYSSSLLFFFSGTLVFFFFAASVYVLRHCCLRLTWLPDAARSISPAEPLTAGKTWRRTPAGKGLARLQTRSPPSSLDDSPSRDRSRANQHHFLSQCLLQCLSSFCRDALTPGGKRSERVCLLCVLETLKVLLFSFFFFFPV